MEGSSTANIELIKYTKLHECTIGKGKIFRYSEWKTFDYGRHISQKNW